MNPRPPAGSDETGAVPPARDRSIWLDQLLGDLKFSARSLCRARGFTLTVLLTLVLGIGVTTLVYDLTQWIIFRQSPYPDAQRLFVIGSTDKKSDTQFTRPGFFLEAYRQQTSVFSEFAAVEHPISNIVLSGQPIPEHIANITPDTLHLLGIQPIFGRSFLADEFKAGNSNVVIISNHVWRKYF